MLTGWEQCSTTAGTLLSVWFEQLESWLFPPSLGFSAISCLETATALWCVSFLKSLLQSRL